MTVRELEVSLDGVLCGILSQDTNGNLQFVYDDEYRRLPDATPLSLSIPLSAARHKKRVVLPYLQGLLPDNHEALNAIARRFSVSANNPFAVIEHVGADVAGAVQVVHPGAPVPDRDRSRTRARALDENDVADMLTRVVQEYEEGAPYYDAIGRFSLAGAQPKIALHSLDDGRWAVPEDAVPTTHILKPVVRAFRRIDVVEWMTMRAAARLGNEVASSDLVEVGPWHVFVSARYDREKRAGRWRRLHQEDLCQALAVPPAKKYQHSDGGPGTAAIGQLLSHLPIDSNRRDVSERFFRAFVFNVVAGCTDAHAKNYSLLLSGRSVRMAPLYDLASYAAYWDGESRLESAMSVGGEYSLAKISGKDLITEGRRFGLEQNAAGEIVEAARTGMLDAFESALAELEVFGREAVSMGDELVRGIRMLPLVQR